MSLEDFEGSQQFNDWQHKMLLYNGDTYLIPAYSKLLVKGFDVKSSEATASMTYTLLIWLNTTSLPKEALDYWTEVGVRYRL